MDPMVVHVSMQASMDTHTDSQEHTGTRMHIHAGGHVAQIKEAASRMSLSFYVDYVIQFLKPEAPTVLFGSYKDPGLGDGRTPSGNFQMTDEETDTLRAREKRVVSLFSQ